MSYRRAAGLGETEGEYFARVGLDPAAFLSRFGRPAPDPHKCLRIQCGAISQSDAGLDLLNDCASAGYSGVRSCADPLCSGDARPFYCNPPAAAATPAMPVSRPVAPAPRPVVSAGGPPEVSNYVPVVDLDSCGNGVDAGFFSRSVTLPGGCCAPMWSLIAAAGAFLLLGGE